MKSKRVTWKKNEYNLLDRFKIHIFKLGSADAAFLNLVTAAVSTYI